MATRKLRRLLLASVVDQNAAHGFGRGREEMAAVAPHRRVVLIHQPQISLVHERRRLQRVPGRLASQLVRRLPSQLLVDQRQELLRRLRIAVLDATKDLGNVGHLERMKAKG